MTRVKMIRPDNFFTIDRNEFGQCSAFIEKEMKMVEINDTLDQIHAHLAKTEKVDPELQKEFHELDKNIRAMKAVQKENGATELAELDKQALIMQLSNILQSMGV